MIKKIFFLILPLIVVYWRSNLAQNAVKWLFRGVLPNDGLFGPLAQRSVQDVPIPREPEQRPHPVKKSGSRSLSARIADNWAVILAFLAGISVAAWIFSFGAFQN
jgi:hypothetical protein